MIHRIAEDRRVDGPVDGPVDDPVGRWCATDPVRSWSDALDSLERSLELAWVVLRDPVGDDGESVWTPPADLGPLPEELAPRARTLLAQVAELEEGLVRRRDALVHEIRANRGDTGPERARPDRSGRSLDLLG